MTQNKAFLRSELRSSRLEQPAIVRQHWSEAIVKRLKRAIPWAELTTVHGFEQIEKLGEVDLSTLYNWLEQNYPSIKLLTSKKINQEWLITEIKDDQPIVAQMFDLILVPMLGFDNQLNRIGYGGGYYDKLLASITTAQKIGVCFEQGHVDKIPVEPHDIKLDVIITESSIYHTPESTP